MPTYHWSDDLELVLESGTVTLHWNTGISGPHPRGLDVSAWWELLEEGYATTLLDPWLAKDAPLAELWTAAEATRKKRSAT